jgi:DNA-binding NtrC family response regulator
LSGLFDVVQDALHWQAQSVLLSADAAPSCTCMHARDAMDTERSLKHYGLLYGSSAAMIAMYRQLERVAGTDATVLLEGESGTGKELVAQTVHRQSPRAERHFVAVNSGAIPAHLIEAALFGHEKGSYTGALKRQGGYFEYASGGTLFLDEITEMPCDMQVKLLRVLESGNFLRVGGSELVQVDVRLVAATNRSLQAAVQEGRLRQDLMYRLAVFPIRVPPLRERGTDIEKLAQYFLEQLNEEAHTAKSFSRVALERLRHHPWPGNVRELKNRVHRAYIMSAGVVEIDEPLQATPRTSTGKGLLNLPVGMALGDAQREIILATLHHFSGNKKLAAETLGISLKTLYNRLKLY